MNERLVPKMGALVESSRRLELSYDDQSHLCQQAIELSDQLDLIAQPHLITEEIAGVKLRPIDGIRGLTDTVLDVAYGEMDGHSPMALINFRDPNANETRTYELGQLNTWEERFDKKGTKTNLRTTSNLALMLSSRLPDGALDAILDDPSIDGLELAKYLTQTLQTKASAYQKTRQYISRDAVVSGTYMSSTEHVMTINSTKRGDEIQLSTEANYDLDGKIVNKQYQYKFRKEIYKPGKKNAFLPGSGGGTITLKSNDGISKAKLDAFIGGDAEESYPAATLRNSLVSIVKQYDPMNRAA